MYDRIPLSMYFCAALILMGCPKKVKPVEGETTVEVEKIPVDDEDLPEKDDSPE